MSKIATEIYAWVMFVSNNPYRVKTPVNCFSRRMLFHSTEHVRCPSFGALVVLPVVVGTTRVLYDRCSAVLRHTQSLTPLLSTPKP